MPSQLSVILCCPHLTLTLPAPPFIPEPLFILKLPFSSFIYSFYSTAVWFGCLLFFISCCGIRMCLPCVDIIWLMWVLIRTHDNVAY